MFLCYLATIASAFALLSGILAIGKGQHFDYTKTDILRGRRNAILYIWVTFSTIFSLGHLASLVTYGLEHDWLYRDYDTGRWMAIHSGIGLLLISAHAYILNTLSTEGVGEDYLWGKRRVR